MSGSPSCPNTSIRATVHCTPFGSLTTSRSMYCHSSMLQSGILFQQLTERSCDLRSGKWFGDQQGFLSFSGSEARVSRLRCIADDHNGNLGVLGILAHRVEERFAHVVRGTIEHQRVSMLLSNHFINGCRVTGRKYFVAVVSQRKRQKLRNLRRVVDQQYPARRHSTSCRRFRCRAAASSCLRTAPDPSPRFARPPCS